MSGLAACFSSLQWLSVWLGPWLGTPAVIAALALVLYPRALVPASATGDDALCGKAGQQVERPLCASYPILDSLAEACEYRGGNTPPPRGAGLLRRLARKLSSCRRRLAHGRDAAAAALHVDAPFFRRRNGLSLRSPRGSSESLATRWGQDYRSYSSRRQHGPALSRLGSGSMSEAMTQDMMSNTAAMSHTARSSKGEWAPSDAFVYTGNLAVDCLPFDTTETVNEEVKQVVTELHLLQFGMLMGESSAELAVGMQGAAQPVGPGPDSLYGEVDCPDLFQRGWERIIEEHKEGLHYWVERRHLRKGLFMYKSRTVYEDARPDQMVAFTFTDCDTRRTLWDDCATALEPIAPPSRPDLQPEAVRAAAAAQSSYMYARTRFPPPMSQREYVYARRVWYKADDGGCYCINKACAHPLPPAAGCRTTRVHDFSSGFVIRAVPGIYSSAPAVEVSTVYFEDSCAHAGIINMAIRKAMWPMTQKSERGLRRYIASHAGGLPLRRSPPFSPAPTSTHSEIEAAEEPLSTLGTLLLTDAFTAEAAGPLERMGSGPLEGSVAPGSAADVFGSSTAFRNASMFSGYYPALTRRLHITPILYACYMAGWRYAALAIRGLLLSSRLSCKLCCRWHAALVRGLLRGIAAAAAKLRERQQQALRASHARSAGADGLKSFPLSSLDRNATSRASAFASGPAGQRSLSMRRQGGIGRRLSQVAAVATRAVGLPLLHGLLSGRFGGAGGRDLDASQGASSYHGEAYDSSSGASPSCSSVPGGSQRGSRFVRPVVVDGVVVGHRPPKQHRPPPKDRARTLIQLMLGLRATEEARDMRPPLHRQPLSRRIM